MSQNPLVAVQIEEAPSSKSLKLYTVAKSAMGTILAPEDPTLGCAISVNRLAKEAWGEEIGGGASTYEMWQALQSSKKFTRVTIGMEKAGDIIISPTNSSLHAKLAHGHCGIVMKYGICSNTSANGLWSENYDMESWVAYFTAFGSLQTLIYRPV